MALALSMPHFEGSKELFATAIYAVVLFSLLIQAPIELRCAPATLPTCLRLTTPRPALSQQQRPNSAHASQTMRIALDGLLKTLRRCTPRTALLSNTNCRWRNIEDSESTAT